KRRVAHQQRATRNVDLHFHLHAKLSTVSEHGLMNRGNPPGSRVQVQSFIEGALLQGAIGKLDLVPAPDVQLRPPGRSRASSTVQSKPALRNSRAETSPAIPAPRMAIFSPLPDSRGR